MRTPFDIQDLQPTITPELKPALWHEGEIVWRGHAHHSADRAAERAMQRQIQLFEERCSGCSARSAHAELDEDGEFVTWCSLSCRHDFYSEPYTRVR